MKWSASKFERKKSVQHAAPLSLKVKKIHNAMGYVRLVYPALNAAVSIEVQSTRKHATEDSWQIVHHWRLFAK